MVVGRRAHVRLAKSNSDACAPAMISGPTSTFARMRADLLEFLRKVRMTGCLRGRLHFAGLSATTKNQPGFSPLARASGRVCRGSRSTGESTYCPSRTGLRDSQNARIG